MNRRTFNELVGLGVLGSVARPHDARALQGAAAEVPSHIPRWPDQTFRRSLVDMHVPDWDPALLSKFDPADIVKTIAERGFPVDDGLRQLARGPVLLAHQDRADASQHARPGLFRRDGRRNASVTAFMPWPTTA